MERTYLILLLSLGLALPSIGFAQDEETYHERLEYDAASGQWIETAPPIPGTEAGDIALARSLLARGEYKAARKAFKKWFKTYPDSPHRPEALFYAAETEVSADDVKPRRGHLIRAYEWLEELLEGWPGTPLADRAVRKEMIIAEMLLFKDRKQRVWGGMLWLSGEEEALEMLNRIIDFWAPDSRLAEQALRLMADYHFQHGEFDEAEMTYARLMREYPRGKYHKIAMLRSGRSALARFHGVEFDEADLLEAEVYLSDFQKTYSQEAAEYGVPQMLGRITESRAHKEYTIARYYERTRKIDAAVYYYRWIAQQHPETTWAAEAENRLVALGAGEPESIDLGSDELLDTPDSVDTADNEDSAALDKMNQQ